MTELELQGGLKLVKVRLIFRREDGTIHMHEEYWTTLERAEWAYSPSPAFVKAELVEGEP